MNANANVKPIFFPGKESELSQFWHSYERVEFASKEELEAMNIGELTAYAGEVEGADSELKLMLSAAKDVDGFYSAADLQVVGAIKRQLALFARVLGRINARLAVLKEQQREQGRQMQIQQTALANKKKERVTGFNHWFYEVARENLPRELFNRLSAEAWDKVDQISEGEQQ